MKTLAVKFGIVIFILLFSFSFSSCNKDTEPPVITILGENPVNAGRGYVYSDAGATAIDNVDGDVSDKIEVASTVDTGFVGQYHVTYTVKDNAGNQSVAERTVIVKEYK